MSHTSFVEQFLQMAPEEGEWSTLSPRLKLFHMKRECERAHIVYAPSLCVVLQGEKRAYVGNECFTYNRNRFLFAGLPVPAEVEVTSPPNLPYLGFLIEVDLDEIIRVMLDIVDSGGLKQEEIQASSKGVFTSPMNDELQDALYRLLLNASDPSRYQVLYQNSLQEVFYFLLTGPQSGSFRNFLTQDSETSSVIRSAKFIDQHFEEALNVSMLANIAGMSESSYYDKFRKVTSLSPMQYVKRIRLYRARLMIAGATSVAQAAFAVGYNSPSQFSRDFRKAYGMSPSDFKQLYLQSIEN